MHIFFLIASLLTLETEPLVCEAQEQTLGGDICDEMEATCGFLENSSGYLVNCGMCNIDYQYCGGAAPNRDGSPGNGKLLTCGGGCTQVTSFTCDLGVAVLCSLPGPAPYNYCSDEGKGKWCC